MSSDRARMMRCTAPGCVAFAVLPLAPWEQQAPQVAGWYDEHRLGEPRSSRRWSKTWSRTRCSIEGQPRPEPPRAALTLAGAEVRNGAYVRLPTPLNATG